MKRIIYIIGDLRFCLIYALFFITNPNNLFSNIDSQILQDSISAAKIKIEAERLDSMGQFVYEAQNKFDSAIICYRKALKLHFDIKDSLGVSNSLENLGFAFKGKGFFDSVIVYHKQSIIIRQALGERLLEARSLSNLGEAFQNLNQYEESYNSFKNSFDILESLLPTGDIMDTNIIEGKASILANLGVNSCYLGKFDTALHYYWGSLQLFKTIGKVEPNPSVFAGLGFAYYSLNNQDSAMIYLMHALSIFQSSGDKNGQATVLGNLSLVYTAMKDYDNAIISADSARLIAREIPNRLEEGISLYKRGIAYLLSQKYNNALEDIGLSLLIFEDNKTREREALAYYRIMECYRGLKNTDLAIFYGKKSINLLQEIRGSIRNLDNAMQRDYVNSKRSSYRELADLLINSGRLPEAQQVLTMLKDEEYFDFIRGSVNDSRKLLAYVNPTVREKEFDKANKNFGRDALEKREKLLQLLSQPSLIKNDTVKIDSLDKEIIKINDQFQKYINNLAVKYAKNDVLKNRLDDIRQGRQFMADLREFGVGTVALFTLVARDNYYVFIVTPEVMIPEKYPIKDSILNQRVVQFCEALQNPLSDPKPQAIELYTMLLKPIEEHLQKLRARTLLWSLDGPLRYLPMAALHDGTKYLAERYINVVFTPTPACYIRLKEKVTKNWSGLGFGVSKAYEPLPALLNVPYELKGIIKQGMGTDEIGVLPGKVMLNEDFTESSMKTALRQKIPHQLVHIASHFNFYPGNISSSFLLLGDGSRLTLEQIKNFPSILGGVELLTLSACNTAVSDIGADGVEVESFAKIALDQGAKSVLASLWQVADNSTSILMRNLYQIREQKPGTSKAKALQQAQLKLLYGDEPSTQSQGLKETGVAHFSHPYYWAPFILIGNWQ